MRRRVATVAAGVGLALLAALPGTAPAATVLIGGGDEVRVFEPGTETNTVTIRRDGANIRVSDTTTALVPGFGCALSGADVLCPAAGILRIEARLGDNADTGLADASIAGLHEIDLDGQDGADTLTSTVADPSGDVFLIGGDGDDTLNGGAADDRLEGDDGADTILAGAGDDWLNGDAGPDQLEGGDGEDRFDSDDDPDGADVIAGGPDDDELELGQRIGAVTATMDGVAGDGEAGENDNFGADLENVRTGIGADVLVGSEADNRLDGGAGNDAISGGGGGDDLRGDRGDDAVSGDGGADDLDGDQGLDSLDGGEGNDFLRGQCRGEPEPDVIAGGGGEDIADYGCAASGVRVDIDGQADDGEPGEGDNVGGDVENLGGSSQADVLIGSKAANELLGLFGADTLRGKAGPDGLSGDRGDDSLNGGKSPDALDGEAGADRIKSRDSSADDVDCGGGPDRVTADRRDRPHADCERVKRKR